MLYHRTGAALPCQTVFLLGIICCRVESWLQGIAGFRYDQTGLFLGILMIS